MRAFLRLLVLITAACAAAPASAKVVVKKGVYGAIAVEQGSGQFGYAYNAATSRAAKLEALSQCADPRCEVIVSFSNACGALAQGQKQYFSATGATQQEAQTKALRRCKDQACTIAAWACTK